MQAMCPRHTNKYASIMFNIDIQDMFVLHRAIPIEKVPRLLNMVLRWRRQAS